MHRGTMSSGLTSINKEASPPPGPGSGPPILEVNNLEVVYSDVILVLRGVSLEVDQGTRRRRAGQQRRRQDHHAAGHHRPARPAPGA